MHEANLQPATIFALSSGQLPSGVAVIRLSGPNCRFVVETLSGTVPAPGQASLRMLRDLEGKPLDRGFVLWFPGPASFTGEDVAEFHVHGGRAVIASLMSVLAGFEGVRLAQAGEFSRRAFENGKLDLAEVEGLADLISAETETQRRAALDQMSGGLSGVTEDWRRRLNHIRAMIEANLDFSDEEDVVGDESAKAIGLLGHLAAEIEAVLEDGRSGEIIRDGLEVVLLGKPNAGKSSLLNALARRDVAIVTEEAGTTRDLIEVRLDISGFAVTLVDTAGLREAESAVERQGIERARKRAGEADLVVWLREADDETSLGELIGDAGSSLPVEAFVSKDDNGRFGEDGVSVRRPDGLDGLMARLAARLPLVGTGREPGLITRQRHREALQDCLEHIRLAIAGSQSEEIVAERLRDSAMALGRITGRVDVEQLLDVIFSEFCVGK